MHQLTDSVIYNNLKVHIDKIWNSYFSWDILEVMGRFILESDAAISGRVVPQIELVRAFDRMGAELARKTPYTDHLDVDFDFPGERSANYLRYPEPTLDRADGSIMLGKLSVDGIAIDADYTFYYSVGGNARQGGESGAKIAHKGKTRQHPEERGRAWNYPSLPADSDPAAAYERHQLTRYLWLAEKALFPEPSSTPASSRALAMA